MSLAGKGVIAIWNDIAPDGRVEFYEWHNREHMPERVGIPGFLRGRRYIAMRGTPEYFTLYEADTAETLGGKDYFIRLNNPTPWTKAVVQTHFRNTSRGVCRVKLTVGVGQGGYLLTLRHGPQPGHETELGDYLIKTALPPVLEMKAVVGVHFCIADKAVSSVETTEKRGHEIGIPNWLVMIESVTPEGAEAACQQLMLGMAGKGAEAAMDSGLYSLQFCRLKTPSTPG